MKTVNIPAKACPVVDEVDVLVVGGGAAGIGAAIGAAQCGASVALVEYFGALGGLLTNGYVTNCEAGVAISGDKILIIDDFLANGKALEGLCSIIEQSGATLQGIGIVVEKGFQGAGDRIRASGVHLESLAIVDRMDAATGEIVFRNQD